MGKRSHERRLLSSEAMAVAGKLRTGSRKLNLVAQMIRGLPADKALSQLKFSPRRIAGEVRRVLESAIANAENNHNLDVDRLIVAEAYVGKSLVMKRFRPRARGRGAQILKPFSRITVVVREQGEK
ncbi:MAG: 50S ribosomal protein L22 [Rhodospirillaceae bacterium]|nr:50S ribosomal protein L22 [Rhodospirillaceae bacterium]